MSSHQLVRWACLLLVLLLSCLALVGAQRQTPLRVASPASNPLVDGKHIFDDINRFATRYWARTAGYDTGLPPHANGHDEFEAEWAKEASTNLHGLPVSIVRQPFKIPGFVGNPPKRDGVNIIAVVPGSITPEVAIILGAHPDGEPTSRGSAYDDTSGSMILLNLTRLLGQEWRSRGLPAITVEFALFDAEEEGLIGSNAYAFNYRHGALMPHPVYMINEEQNGVGYPVRPFGLARMSSVALHGITTGSLPSSMRNQFGPFIPPQPVALATTMARLKKARSQVFKELQKAYGRLSYRGGTRNAFGASNQHYFSLGPTRLCCSDNDPFETLGLPTTTFAGDYNYYDPNAPSWAYPYDQAEDTPAALACDTGGSPKPTKALQAALDVPLEMSRILVDDYAPPSRRNAGITAFSSLPLANAPTTFNLLGAQSATWSFGDGSSGKGAEPSHVYKRPGVYTIAIKHGQSVSHFNLEVLAKAPPFNNPLRVRPPPRRSWHPGELQSIPGCH